MFLPAAAGGRSPAREVEALMPRLRKEHFAGHPLRPTSTATSRTPIPDRVPFAGTDRALEGVGEIVGAADDLDVREETRFVQGCLANEKLSGARRSP